MTAVTRLQSHYASVPMPSVDNMNMQHQAGTSYVHWLVVCVLFSPHNLIRKRKTHSLKPCICSIEKGALDFH
jgi:hypothetical protein